MDTQQIFGLQFLLSVIVIGLPAKWRVATSMAMAVRALRGGLQWMVRADRVRQPRLGNSSWSCTRRLQSPTGLGRAAL